MVKPFHVNFFSQRFRIFQNVKYQFRLCCIFLQLYLLILISVVIYSLHFLNNKDFYIFPLFADSFILHCFINISLLTQLSILFSLGDFHIF